jgi:hypothetical protein
MSFRLRCVRLRLELVQACLPCPPGGECEGKLRRPFPRRGISQQQLAPCGSPRLANQGADRVHVRWASDAGQRIQRRRSSDRQVPLHRRMPRWRDVGPVLPRLRRHEVCRQKRQASSEPVVAGLTLLRTCKPLQGGCSRDILRAVLVAGAVPAMSATTACGASVTSADRKRSCSSCPEQSQLSGPLQSRRFSSGAVCWLCRGIDAAVAFGVCYLCCVAADDRYAHSTLGSVLQLRQTADCLSWSRFSTRCFA